METSMLQSLNGKHRGVNRNFAADVVPTTITGYALALSRASAAERAFIAAKLVLGYLALIDPRVTQAARLVRVSEPYVEAALEILRSGRPGLETGARNGTFSLFEAAVLAKYPEPALTDMFLVATPAERANLARPWGRRCSGTSSSLLTSEFVLEGVVSRECGGGASHHHRRAT
jgi:hypothetical protein